MIGYSLANLQKYPKIKMNKCLITWGLIALLCNFELYIILKYRLGGGSATLIKPFAVITFFVMSINSTNINPHVSKILGKCSSVIYFSHILIRNLLMLFIENPYVCWLLTVFFGIIITLIFERLKPLKKFNWLKNIY